MSLGPALKRSWFLVAACVVLCTGAGVAAGLLRQPQYRTEAQLYVGTFDVRTLSRSGVVQASQSLANAYSRLALSRPIVGPVASELGLPQEEVRRRLSSAAIPGTPVLRIEAIGPSRTEAVTLVRAVSARLAARVTRITNRETEARSLLRRFRAAASYAAAVEARAAQARSSGAGARRIRDVQSAAETARLRANALAGLYADARASSAGALDAHIVDAGFSVTNDRVSMLQLLCFIGAASGLVLGAALAALRHRRLLRRE